MIRVMIRLIRMEIGQEESSHHTQYLQAQTMSEAFHESITSDRICALMELYCFLAAYNHAIMALSQWRSRPLRLRDAMCGGAVQGNQLIKILRPSITLHATLLHAISPALLASGTADL